MAAQKGVKNICTKSEFILDLGSFFIQLMRSDSLNHLDLVIAKESKRTESARCAVSGKSFGNETVMAGSVPQKPITL